MSCTHFTSNQQVEIAALLRTSLKQKDIAKLLGKHASSISRELKRNSGPDRKYYAVAARRKTKQRRIKANQRFRKIENNPVLEKYIINKTKKYWSPEQIAGRLRRKCGETIICHESIYTYIREDNPELNKYFRSQKGKYRRRHGTKRREKQGEERKKKRIDSRPEIVEKRVRLGDWEGDFIFSRERKVGIMTHVNRVSGFTLGDKMDSLLSTDVSETTVKRFQKIPRDKKYTITYDNDTRLAEHELIERNSEIDIYFANPYHFWERGINENTNGLLRQFFPKKSCFTEVNQKDVERAVRLLNSRPRKRLNYLTPYEMFRKNCTLD